MGVLLPSRLSESVRTFDALCANFGNFDEESEHGAIVLEPLNARSQVLVYDKREARIRLFHRGLYLGKPCKGTKVATNIGAMLSGVDLVELKKRSKAMQYNIAAVAHTCSPLT